MNNSLPRLIDGIIATLRQEVIPHTQGDFARGQAFGIVFALENIKRRASWSNEYLGEQLAALDEAAMTLAQLAADLPGAPLPGRPPISSLPAAVALEAERDAGDARICDLIDWLRINRDALAPDAAAQADAAIAAYIRRQLKWELSTSAPPMFDQISRGAD